MRDPNLTTRRRTLARRQRRAAAGALAAVVVLLAAATGCSEDRTPETAATQPARPDTGGCHDDLLACARSTTIGALVPDESTAATGEPLVLGMVNQENTAVGSFPELSGATRAGIEFINSHLGGVGGRPLEIALCNTEFSAEGSTACAQEMVDLEVPAVLGGIDVFGTGIETLQANGIPYVGGIPVSAHSATVDTSFQWSGGTWGAAIAFADHAARSGAERVAIVYGDFGPIAQGAEMARQVLSSRGVETQLVPMPIVATDLTSPLGAAHASEPHAVFVLTADTGCKAAFDGAATIGLDAQLYLVGACASPTILDQLPDERTDGAIFNVEGQINLTNPDPDATLYSAVIETYGDGLDPIGAGTVTFRALMNLYRVLHGLEEVTAASITEALRAQTGAPSFMGHDYTCDGEQLDGLPALCSPQQILAQLRAGALTQLGGWVDVGRVLAET